MPTNTIAIDDIQDRIKQYEPAYIGNIILSLTVVREQWK